MRVRFNFQGVICGFHPHGRRRLAISSRASALRPSDLPDFRVKDPCRPQNQIPATISRSPARPILAAVAARVGVRFNTKFTKGEKIASVRQRQQMPDILQQIIRLAIKVHRALGPGVRNVSVGNWDRPDFVMKGRCGGFPQPVKLVSCPRTSASHVLGASLPWSILAFSGDTGDSPGWKRLDAFLTARLQHLEPVLGWPDNPPVVTTSHAPGMSEFLCARR